MPNSSGASGEVEETLDDVPANTANLWNPPPNPNGYARVTVVSFDTTFQLWPKPQNPTVKPAFDKVELQTRGVVIVSNVLNSDECDFVHLMAHLFKRRGNKTPVKTYGDFYEFTFELNHFTESQVPKNLLVPFEKIFSKVLPLFPEGKNPVSLVQGNSKLEVLMSVLYCLKKPKASIQELHSESTVFSIDDESYTGYLALTDNIKPPVVIEPVFESSEENENEAYTKFGMLQYPSNMLENQSNKVLGSFKKGTFQKGSLIVVRSDMIRSFPAIPENNMILKFTTKPSTTPPMDLMVLYTKMNGKMTYDDLFEALYDTNKVIGKENAELKVSPLFDIHRVSAKLKDDFKKWVGKQTPKHTKIV